MSTNRFGELEVLCSVPKRTEFRHPTPLLFVHGAYMGAWCWKEHFLPWFSARGWPSYAVSLSGHGASRNRDYLDFYSIDNYVEDIAEVAAKLPSPPVVIGHSMGGMVVQKYLERFNAPAAVLLASVPPQGLMPAAIGLMTSKPSLFMTLNTILTGADIDFENDLESLRDLMFHQPIDANDLVRYFALTQPESRRALWDMTLFNLPRTSIIKKVPMLVIGGAHDQLITVGQVRSTAATYEHEAEIFEEFGHSMMLEHSWEKLAVRLDHWLCAHTDTLIETPGKRRHKSLQSM